MGATVTTIVPGETGPGLAPQTAYLMVVEAEGEANALTISLVGPDGEGFRYAVQDAVAPLSAGAGCSGGGPPGSPVTCVLPRSRPQSACIRGFCSDPGLRIELDVALGHGMNSLDASTLPQSDSSGAPDLSLTVRGGDQADVITTGSANDRVDPGGGADIVRAGAGFDSVIAAVEAPDGPDHLDLGPGTDFASFARATAPLTLSSDGVPNDGAAGEADNLVGAEYLQGGRGDDTLIGRSAAEQLAPLPGRPSERLDGREGADLILGNGGVDDLRGGGGADRLRGSAGADLIFGDNGPDRLLALSGKDEVDGGGGDDRAFGGSGADVIDGGPGRDLLACGRGGRDRAVAERGERTTACERVRLRRRS